MIANRPHQRVPAIPSRRVLLLLASLAAGIVVAAFTGCQTPPQNAYAGTVPPPATGMIGQPAPYASYVSTPQGAAYPGAPPMPGPTTTWQGGAPTVPPTFANTSPAPMTAPTMPAAPAATTAPSNNTWTWAQTGNQPTAPSLQQYSNQLTNQANQAQQSLSQQGQQLANQWQNTANQYQQQLSQQPQQWTNQAQATANQYQQQFNNQIQQANTQAQQAMQQAWPQQPTQQTANGSWWPFTNASQVPPARATPAVPTKY